MGYELRINRTGVQGASNWTRVGGLFASLLEANEYRKKNYLNVEKYFIAGINLSAPDKIRKRFQFAVEKDQKEVNKKRVAE